MVTIALEGQNRVDDVFQHPRSGERSLLRHVSDKNHGDVALFRHSHQCVRALPNLPDAARAGCERGVGNRLDRINDKHVRHDGIDLAEEGGEIVFCGEEHERMQRVEALSSQSDLLT